MQSYVKLEASRENLSIDLSNVVQNMHSLGGRVCFAMGNKLVKFEGHLASKK